LAQVAAHRGLPEASFALQYYRLAAASGGFHPSEAAQLKLEADWVMWEPVVSPPQSAAARHAQSSSTRRSHGTQRLPVVSSAGWRSSHAL